MTSSSRSCYLFWHDATRALLQQITWRIGMLLAGCIAVLILLGAGYDLIPALDPLLAIFGPVLLFVPYMTIWLLCQQAVADARHRRNRRERTAQGWCEVNLFIC